MPLYLDPALIDRLGPAAREKVMAALEDRPPRVVRLRRAAGAARRAEATPDDPEVGSGENRPSWGRYDWKSWMTEPCFSVVHLGLVVLAGLGVLAGVWLAIPTVAPAGWTLEPSLAGRVALLLTGHLGRVWGVILPLGTGAVAWRWGNRPTVARWLAQAARLALMIGAVAVAWAAARG